MTSVFQKWSFVLCCFLAVHSLALAGPDDSTDRRASIQQQLNTGTPFSDKARSQLQKITDVPMTKAGLQSMYGGVFQKGTAVLKIGEDAAYAEQDTFSFSLDFISQEDEKKGHAYVYLYRKDNSTCLHIKEIGIKNKAFRGMVLSRFLQASVTLLQALSSSPESKISLHAFTSTEYHGAYLWAPYGFDFSLEDHGEYAVDMEDVRTDFEAWLTGMWLSKKERADIIAASKKWVHTWDISSFDATPFAGRPIGKLNGKLGKQFLGDGSENQSWYGDLFVNQPNSPGMQQYERRIKEDLQKDTQRPQLPLAAITISDIRSAPSLWHKFNRCREYLENKLFERKP